MNRYARSWQSALCEVARHEARSGSDREGACVHRGGIAPRRKPRARANSNPVPFADAAPLRRASDRSPRRTAAHPQPSPLCSFLPCDRCRGYSSADASHLAATEFGIRHALTAARSASWFCLARAIARRAAAAPFLARHSLDRDGVDRDRVDAREKAFGPAAIRLAVFRRPFGRAYPPHAGAVLEAVPESSRARQRSATTKR
jgi:hypothetical protein